MFIARKQPLVKNRQKNNEVFVMRGCKWKTLFLQSQNGDLSAVIQKKASYKNGYLSIILPIHCKLFINEGHFLFLKKKIVCPHNL